VDVPLGGASPGRRVDMRFFKLAAPALVGFASMVALSAQAAEEGFVPPPPPPAGLQLCDFYAVNGDAHAPGMDWMLNVVSSPMTDGMMVTITADGVPVGSLCLLPGDNWISIADTGATTLTVSGAGIEGKSILQEGWGINY
jgi:hypothetical protein